MKDKHHNSKKVLVNCITASRLLSTAAVVPVFMLCGPMVTGIMIGSFFLTDAVDGFLARKLHVQSFIGSLLDSISDKSLAIMALVALSTLNPFYVLPIGLEFGIMGVNYKKFKENQNVQSSKLGKLKTWVLGLGIASGFVFSEISTNPTISSMDPETASKFLTGGALVSAFASSVALVDYYLQNKKVSDNIEMIHEEKEVLEEKRKSLQETWFSLTDTDYYLEHKDDPAKKLFYK